MASVVEAAKWTWEHLEEIVAAANALLAAGILVGMLIPGPHPEDWFRAAADFLAKFSRKPAEPAAPPAPPEPPKAA
jgi:hypothetical protein